MKTEPALILGALQAAIVLAVSFGLELSTEQVAAILSLSAVVLSIVTRQLVTPTAKLPTAKLPPALLVAIVAASLSLSGCSALGAVASAALDGLAKASHGAQYIGSLLDEAKSHSDMYLERHPNLEARNAITVAHRDAAAAVSALNATAAAAKAADDGELAAAKDRALDAYAVLRALLERYGILSGNPPAGGADGIGPEPGPLELPTAEQLQGAL